LVEHYRKILEQEAHGHLDPENVGYLCGGHDRRDQMAHSRMRGNYKKGGKCGGR